jgi:hypothetical protein
LGFEQAGFDVMAAVEYDPIHAAAHAFNFPECAVLARSVVGLTGIEIRRVANIGDKRVDVVFGGPPCQGFSLIGQRVLDDPRNSLVREFVRIVREVDANYFVFENVKGLTVGTHRKFLGGVDRGVPLDRLQCASAVAHAQRRFLWHPADPRAPDSDWCAKRPETAGLSHRHDRPDGSDTVLAGLTLGPNCADALADLLMPKASKSCKNSTT